MKWISLLIILPTILLSSYSWERSPAQNIVENSIDMMYNYHFDTSLSLLDSAWNIDNSHPVVPFLMIAVKFLESQVEDNYDISYDLINSEVTRAIPIYKNLIKLYPEDPEYLLYLGASYGLRARVSLGREDWLGLLYYGYQGLRYINLAEEIDSELMDIYVPIGIMEYASCLTPSSIQWFASWVGLTGDCNLGKEYIKKAVDNSKYSYVEGANVLSYIYMHIDRDYSAAETVIIPLIKEFPEHPYFALLHGELLARKGEWDKLENIMPSLKNFSKNGPPLQRTECALKLKYIQALYKFDEGDYHDVIQYTTWITDNYQMEFFWLQGFTYMLRAKSYDMLGKRNLAISDYNNVLNMDHFYQEIYEAEAYLITPFTLSK